MCRYFLAFFLSFLFCSFISFTFSAAETRGHFLFPTGLKKKKKNPDKSFHRGSTAFSLNRQQPHSSLLNPSAEIPTRRGITGGGRHGSGYTCPSAGIREELHHHNLQRGCLKSRRAQSPAAPAADPPESRNHGGADPGRLTENSQPDPGKRSLPGCCLRVQTVGS